MLPYDVIVLEQQLFFCFWVYVEIRVALIEVVERHPFELFDPFFQCSIDL